MYDVSQRNTFDELIKWFREIDTYCAEDVVKIIVGNKVDKVALVATSQTDGPGVHATGDDGGGASVR